MKRHKNKWITLTGRSFLLHFYSTCYLARSTIFKTLTPEASKGFRKTKFICFTAGIFSLLGPGPFPSMHAEASCIFFLYWDFSSVAGFQFHVCVPVVTAHYATALPAACTKARVTVRGTRSCAVPRHPLAWETCCWACLHEVYSGVGQENRSFPNFLEH